MGKIHNVEKLTDNRFVNLYHVDATSVHNTPVSYFVASRAKTVSEMKLKTGKNDPDGVIIYSLYGEKKDRVVLIRQYRYTLGGYVYEFPAGLVGKIFTKGQSVKCMKRQVLPLLRFMWIRPLKSLILLP